MSELVKRLYGPRTSSHGGRYVYRRKGLLDEIPAMRLIRGVIIVTNDGAGRVKAFLRTHGAEVQARMVELTKADQARLGGRAVPSPRARD